MLDRKTVHKNLLMIERSRTFVPQRISGALWSILAETGCLVEIGNGEFRLRYHVAVANGLVYLIDLATKLGPGDHLVYPYHDEASDLLKMVRALAQTFDLVIDSFCGGGHSMLPILEAGLARQGAGIDINPRAVGLAKINARLNGLEHFTEFAVGDVNQDLPKDKGKTVYITNPPFALAVEGVQLELMRDGGENGLVLSLAFARRVNQQIKTGDVICGLAYSRITKAGEVELERELSKVFRDKGQLTVHLVENASIWRGPDGKKSQPNPMPLSRMYTKAKPDDIATINAYTLASEYHIFQGWEALGYFQWQFNV